MARNRAALATHVEQPATAVIRPHLREGRREPHFPYIGDGKNLSSAFHNDEEMIEAEHASND